VCQPLRRSLCGSPVAPKLEIRHIGDLTMEQFRGIFRITYTGDAYIVLRTKGSDMCRMLCCALCPLHLLHPHPVHALAFLPKSPKWEFLNFLVSTEAVFRQDVTLTLLGVFRGLFAPSLPGPTFRRQLTILQANPLNPISIS
jgi:hypothetical protein